jgi:hypothetical protein
MLKFLVIFYFQVKKDCLCIFFTNCDNILVVALFLVGWLDIFRHLRELFAIDPADYMHAICGSDSLREMSSPGKSGSIFYLTQDDRFIIKTVKKSEVKVCFFGLLHSLF